MSVRILSAPQLNQPQNEVSPQKPEEKKKGIFSSIYEDLKGRGVRILDRASLASENISRSMAREAAGGQSRPSTVFQTLGELGSVGTEIATETLGAGLKGIANISAGVRSGDKTMSEQYQIDAQGIKDGLNLAFNTEFGKKLATNVEELGFQWKKLQETNPVLAGNIKAGGQIADFVLTFASPELLKAPFQSLVKTVEKEASFIGKQFASRLTKEAEQSALKTTGEAALKSAEGVAQKPSTAGSLISEYTERIPRAVEKLQSRAEQAALRAERIANATPDVAQAIKVGLDDGIINTIEQASPATKNAYKEMVENASSSAYDVNRTLKVTSPTSPITKSADEILTILNDERKSIGQKIGTASDALPTKYVSMGDARLEMEEGLRMAGIKVTDAGLDFGGLYSKAQQSKINELYELATEGLNRITARQVHQKDQLFSQLQREARMEGVGDVLVKMPNGDLKSMFQIFREVYSNKLDTLSPEIRELNRQYRESVLLLDDLDNTILKSPGNITNTANPAEFAQINLRRILSDAQSAPAFESVMDTAYTKAVELGYEGADPSDLIRFSSKMRDLYPTVIPSNSFPGGIRTGVKSAVGDLASKFLELGKPGLEDQQIALEKLLGISRAKQIITGKVPRSQNR